MSSVATFTRLAWEQVEGLRMIRSIAVPLDGSRFAETVIPIARQLAHSARARLHLLLVHEPRRSAAATGDDGVGRAREARYLAEAVSRVASCAGPVTDFSVRDGEPGETLPAGIRDVGADLVIMATHGKGSPAPLFPSSVSIAEGLIRTSPAPLLLVRPQDYEAPVLVNCLRSVLVPLDLARDPETAIDAVIDFACLTQAHVTVLNVLVPDGQTDELPDRRAARDGASPAEDRRWKVQKHLDCLADDLRARGIPASARVVVGSDIAATILAELTRGKADFLAISPRGADTSSWRPGDGITETVVRNATKPVLILPAVAAPRVFASAGSA